MSYPVTVVYAGSNPVEIAGKFASSPQPPSPYEGIGYQKLAHIRV